MVTLAISMTELHILVGAKIDSSVYNANLAATDISATNLRSQSQYQQKNLNAQTQWMGKNETVVVAGSVIGSFLL